jgi:hypothetical protein
MLGCGWHRSPCRPPPIHEIEKALVQGDFWRKAEQSSRFLHIGEPALDRVHTSRLLENRD